jgi:hypothetical protein
MGIQSSFATTQAAWRFYVNQKTTLSTFGRNFDKSDGRWDY